MHHDQLFCWNADQYPRYKLRSALRFSKVPLKLCHLICLWNCTYHYPKFKGQLSHFHHKSPLDKHKTLHGPLCSLTNTIHDTVLRAQLLLILRIPPLNHPQAIDYFRFVHFSLVYRHSFLPDRYQIVLNPLQLCPLNPF